MTQSVAQGAAPAKRPSYWSIISKNFSSTVVDSIRTIGRSVRMLIMSLVALVTDTIRGRLQWKEALNQVWYMIGVTSFPGILIAIPFGIVISIQVGNIIAQLGADSLQGAAGGLAVIPGFVTLFSLGGATFGMAEEAIPFVLIFIPLALALRLAKQLPVASGIGGGSADAAAALRLLGFVPGALAGIGGRRRCIGCPLLE